MKNNNLRLLINPFTRIAGWEAFFVGLVVVCVTVITGHLNNIYYPGALDTKILSGCNLSIAFSLQTIGIITLVMLMYIAALIYSKNIRFQDILGTVTLSRFPFLLISLIGFFIPIESSKDFISAILNGTFNLNEYYGIFIITLISIPIIIWYIALLYNAFSVSTGIKGGKGIITFISVVLVSEIISMFVSFLLIPELMPWKN